jgi:hypothetical protein
MRETSSDSLGIALVQIVIALTFFLAAAPATRGSDVSPNQVEPGSELERKPGYKVTVEDKYDEWQSDTRDGIRDRRPGSRICGKISRYGSR